MLALIMTKSSNYFLSLLSVIFISLILCKELKVKRRLIDIFTKEGKVRNVLIFMKELLIGSGREKEKLSSERFPVNHKIRIITKEDIKYWFLGNFICIIAGFSIIFYIFFLGKFNLGMSRSLYRSTFFWYSVLYMGPLLGGLIIKYIRKDMPWYLYGTVGIVYTIIHIRYIGPAYGAIHLYDDLTLNAIFDSLHGFGMHMLGDCSIAARFYHSQNMFFYAIIIPLASGIILDFYRIRKRGWRVILKEEVRKLDIKENFKYLFWGSLITWIACHIFSGRLVELFFHCRWWFYFSDALIPFMVAFFLKRIKPELPVCYYTSTGWVCTLVWSLIRLTSLLFSKGAFYLFCNFFDYCFFICPVFIAGAFLGGAIVDIYRYFKFKNSPYYE